jgi:hypothetical protein
MIRTTITLEKDVHKRLKREALEKDLSLNDLLRNRVLSSLEEDKKTIAKRKKALKRIRELTKDIDFSGLDYKELVNYGRKY